MAEKKDIFFTRVARRPHVAEKKNIFFSLAEKIHTCNLVILKNALPAFNVSTEKAVISFSGYPSVDILQWISNTNYTQTYV